MKYSQASRQDGIDHVWEGFETMGEGKVCALPLLLPVWCMSVVGEWNLIVPACKYHQQNSISLAHMACSTKNSEARFEGLLSKNGEGGVWNIGVGVDWTHFEECWRLMVAIGCGLCTWGFDTTGKGHYACSSIRSSTSRLRCTFTCCIFSVRGVFFWKVLFASLNSALGVWLFLP